MKLTNAILKPFRVLTTVLFLLGSCTMSSYNVVWRKREEILKGKSPLTYICAWSFSRGQVQKEADQKRLAFFSLFSIHYHRGATCIAERLSFGQPWVYVGAGWTWVSPSWQQLLVSPHRNQYCSCPATEALQHKPNAFISSSHQKEPSTYLYIWDYYSGSPYQTKMMPRCSPLMQALLLLLDNSVWRTVSFISYIPCQTYKNPRRK